MVTIVMLRTTSLIDPIFFQIFQGSDYSSECRLECMHNVRTTGPSYLTERLQISCFHASFCILV